jgi:hypothetical protein
MPFRANLVESRERCEGPALGARRNAWAVVLYPEAHHLIRLHLRTQLHARRLPAVLEEADDAGQGVLEVVGCGVGEGSQFLVVRVRKLIVLTS